MRAAIAAGVLLLLVGPTHADDDYGGGSVIFVRGSALYRTDPRGRGETEVAQLPAQVAVRALRTDARGKVLLADLGGRWSWMKLDGSTTTLTELPCADGPAQLAVDGACVLCRSTTSATGSVIVNLATARTTPIEIPAPGARLVGEGANRRLIWADASGVWSSPPGDAKKKQQVAPEPPLRSFLPSPDGSRAVGVFLDKVYQGKQTKPAELLMSFALDGQAVRRKAIKSGVPIEWSYDNRWVLVQDGSSSCTMSATGGEYKCFKGYTGASIAPDGQWSLALGNRNAKADADKTSKKSSKKGSKKESTKNKDAKKEDAEPTGEAETREGDDGAPTDDVAVPPPTGPLALYRLKLAGAFNESPALIVKVVDGAAVWVPAP
ncbi:MAG: hypothetical protein JWP01_812 [Myxococcales bacterium]|nr:hypothetical protein [Myxococcales bacterium]